MPKRSKRTHTRSLARATVVVALTLAGFACEGAMVGDRLGGGVDAGPPAPPQSWPDASVVSVDATTEVEPRHDCRDDYPDIPWTYERTSECSKCYDCAGEGFLPGIAFITCKIEDACYRFATVDNCNYDLCPKGSCTLPVHDADAYCRKDGINYSYFVCRIRGALLPFQTVNATNYFLKSDVEGDVVYDVADALPIVGGCID